MPWHIGIDENGLGPQLGPLIVTAVMAHTSNEATHRMSNDPRSFLHERLADSKKLVDHRHVTLGEAWARALISDPVPDPESLLQHLSLDGMDALRSLCPPIALPQCWSTGGEMFHACPQELTQAQEDVAQLRACGLEIRWVRSSIVCVLRMNQARETGVGRLDLDLRSMEALLKAARCFAGQDLVARCGKVGGMMRYAARFTLLSEHLVSVLEERRERSSYRLAGLGQVDFLRDAEEEDPLVSLASLVGKWVREAMMGRIVRYYRDGDESLPEASGYNDPVTDRFVRASEERRRQVEIPEDCFRRRGSKKP